MARPLRIEYADAVYYVTSRGSARADIFLTEADRQAFLDILASVVEKYNWLCHAYCLLDNRYHLIVETPHPNLSLGMRQLNGVYTQTFNRAHQRSGHVFQGRYKAILAEKGSRLLEFCRYVVKLPVQVGLVAKPEEWRWSSYTNTAWGVKVPAYLTVDWVLDQFAERRTTARQRYCQFVAEGLAGPVRPEKKPFSHIFLGSDAFAAGMRKYLEARQGMRNIPRAQRYPGRPPLSRLFTDIQAENRLQRNMRISEAHITYGYTLQEIADALNLHYSTVSKIAAAKRNK
ncbi:MAG TPA: addiction module toxin RelE [Desulfobulbaceae bacterium]|nr:addiction module toxin RelE [Desulfobulbaceae bacterium]